MITYTKGDVVQLRSGDVWIVRDARPNGESPARLVVGLVDPDHLNHGTGFYGDALDQVVVDHRRGPLPDERYVTSSNEPGTWYVRDEVKQRFLVERFDQQSAERRTDELNDAWRQQVLARI
jgi:hypothetical protein